MNSVAHSGKYVPAFFSRRDFLKATAASLTLATLPFTGCAGNNKKKKLILSFYMDDTNPGKAGPDAFKTFIQYCKEHGIRGESSLIMGYDGKSIADFPDPDEEKYMEYVRSAYDHGIDSHMEIMTHAEMYDFEAGRIRPDGIHEGLWLHEPGIPMDEYYRYFSSILVDGSKAGLKFTGLTWPGCSCDTCTIRYNELRKEGPLKFNPNVFQALLRLVKEGKFRDRIATIFYDADENDYGIFQRAAEGKYGIYDLMPNVMDYFASWDNSKDRLNPDYYISEDGTTGMIIEHLQKGAPYAMWYMHWQGVNPGNGLGWEAFKTVTSRIEKHLIEEVVWMKPGEIARHYHDAGGWNFLDNI